MNDKLTLKAIKWINSSEGKRALEKSHNRAKQNTDSLEKVRKVDPESLISPVTI